MIAAPLLLVLLCLRADAQLDSIADHYDAADDSKTNEVSQPASATTSQPGSGTSQLVRRQRVATGRHLAKRAARMSDATAAAPSSNHAANTPSAQWTAGTCILPPMTIVCAGPKCVDVVSSLTKMKCTEQR